MNNFFRSPLFLLLIIGILIGVAAIVKSQNVENEVDNTEVSTSKSFARKAVENYFSYGKQHNEACIQYLAPVLEKYYLQKNITRERTLSFSRDWWQKYPYEEFNIKWDTVEETDLGNGYTQFKTQMNYCKGKESYDMNCKDITLIIKLNGDNEIYYLANK